MKKELVYLVVAIAKATNHQVRGGGFVLQPREIAVAKGMNPATDKKPGELAELAELLEKSSTPAWALLDEVADVMYYACQIEGDSPDGSVTDRVVREVILPLGFTGEVVFEAILAKYGSRLAAGKDKAREQAAIRSLAGDEPVGEDARMAVLTAIRTMLEKGIV